MAALQFASAVLGPLNKLFGSKFSAPNFQFPPGHQGPSIMFTPQMNTSVSFAKNLPAAGGMTFGMGNLEFALPQQIEMSFGANYQETEMSNLLRAYNGDSAGATAKEFGTRLATAAGDSALAGAENFTGLSGLKASVYAKTNTAYNNHMEVMFQGMAFREFSFAFKFFPRDAGEADRLKGQINQLKYHMHPNFKEGFGGSIFDVPSKFSINIKGDSGFYGGFCEAVLVSMSINGSGSGVAAAHKDGMPAEIDVSLTFKETSYLTKERLDGIMGM
jgi:hypothetical protein